MLVTVNPPLMSLGQPEPPLQVQVVPRHLAGLAAGKESRAQLAIILLSCAWNGSSLWDHCFCKAANCARRSLSRPFSGSRVAATRRTSATCCAITTRSAATAAKPASMRSASRVKCAAVDPLFRLQVALEGLLHFGQGFGHPLPWRLQRAPVIVVEDAPDGGTVIENDIPRRGGGCPFGRSRLDERRRRRVGRIGHPLRQYLTLDGPQATHVLTHLDFRVAVGFQHRLRQVAQEVVVAVAVRHPREFGGDAGHEGVLLVRDPTAPAD